MKIACIQFPCIEARPRENLKLALSLIMKAIKKGAELIVLPESFDQGYHEKTFTNEPGFHTKEIHEKLKEISGEFSVMIVAGIVENKKGKNHNVAIFYVNGRHLPTYSKTHLFSLMNEDKKFKTGSKAVLWNVKKIKLAPIICYDLRFPELSRNLALKGAHILVVPAAWPHPRKHAYRTLLQARAIENQFFVVAANQVGIRQNNAFFGASMIVGPDGKILAESKTENTEIVFCKIDLNDIKRVRAHIPVFKDRNVKVYR